MQLKTPPQYFKENNYQVNKQMIQAQQKKKKAV